MFRPNADVNLRARGTRMRFAWPSAFILAVLIAAAICTAVWQLSPEIFAQRPMISEPIPGRMASLDPAKGAARFRCDSLVAEDCFEMFHRQSSTQAAAVPFMPVFDFGSVPGLGRTETAACLSDALHRDDRCPTRESR